jgi:hypothetical protein
MAEEDKHRQRLESQEVAASGVKKQKNQKKQKPPPIDPFTPPPPADTFPQVQKYLLYWYQSTCLLVQND